MAASTKLVTLARNAWFLQRKCALPVSLSQRFVSDRRRSAKKTKQRQIFAPLDSSVSKPHIQVSFSALCSRRQDEARRSVIIQCANTKGHNPTATQLTCSHLYQHCQTFGPVRNVFHYTRHEKNYVLVEFDKYESVQDLLEAAVHFGNEQKIPVRSRILWYPNTFSGHTVNIQGKLRTEGGEPPVDSLNLLMCSSVSDQMHQLCTSLQMTELGTRLRFLSCSIIEDALRGILHKCQVHPFGSSVNGFGKHDSDLDMVLRLEKNVTTIEKSPAPQTLYFMTKQKMEDERIFTQRCADTIGGLLQSVMPQVYNVQRILKARVPIVKFLHGPTNLDCDLSLFNWSAVYMSELLYTFSECDPRVRPLVFTVRHWAKKTQVTYSNPGPWLSNYMLTLLVIYFLQTTPKPVLPPVNKLKQLAGPEDKKTVGGVECTFTSDPSKVAPSQNKDDLGELLQQFFNFYGSFDFSECGISLVEGSTISKSDSSVIHIENPIETGLNVSQNVMETDLARFQSGCMEAYATLGKHFRKSPIGQDWGIMSILYTNSPHNLPPDIHIDIEGLFDGKDSTSDDHNKDSLSAESHEKTSERDSLSAVSPLRV